MSKLQKTPIRILHVVEPLATGILQALVQICHGLGDGFRFQILHGVREDTPPDVESRFPAGVTFTRWQVGREISPRSDPAALRQLVALIRESKPDIVHAHSSKAGALARIAGLITGCRVVYTPHCYAFLRQDTGWVKHKMFALIERLLGRFPHITAACGPDEYALSLRVARASMLISNGVDLADFEALRGTVPDPKLIVMVGSLRPQKNLALFCRIAADPALGGLRFLWVGGGSVPAELSVPANVEITGHVSRARALELVASASVFLQTSLWEGLPYSMLEAMALDKPVVSSTTVGNFDLVSHGVNGFLCRTPADFSQALSQLTSDPALHSRMATAARHTIETGYNVEEQLGRWAALYGRYDLFLDFLTRRRGLV